MREVGGVGLLPALCRRRTACRRNVLRSRRNMTVSSLPGAVMVRDIIGQSDWMFPIFESFMWTLVGRDISICYVGVQPHFKKQSNNNYRLLVLELLKSVTLK